ncbi:MAG: BF3164 family lipoprotein [Bacteroidales bacterium]
MKRVTLILILIALLNSCKHNKNSEGDTFTSDKFEYSHDSIIHLSPLKSGIEHVTNNSFGDIIELKGISVPVNEIFKVNETQMLVKDSLLIVRNRFMDDNFMVYSLPDFRFLHSFGRAGRGPEEFQNPNLIKSHNNDVLFYIFELIQNKMYSVNMDFEINQLMYSLPNFSGSMFSIKQIVHISDSTFIMVDSTPKGKEIFDLKLTDNDSYGSEIYNLSFIDNRKNWAVYTGEFGVNPKANRMVYAYKYFKRLKFIDTESKESKTVIFKEYENKLPDFSDILAPHNKTHYWGLSAQEKHVYLLYSGRTPIDVSNENRKSSGYIYVEQFDWNGNPIRKFKLDRWGYFCVNEDEDTIFLMSNVDEHPFYMYKLPENK